MPEATHVASGKVRELYALDDDRLLLVASDRISTFDVDPPDRDPGQGARAHRPLRLLVHAPARDRPEPHARDPRRRPLDGVPAARDAADRVRRARLPRRLGLEGLPGDRRDVGPPRCRRGCASRTSCPSRSSRRRRRRRPATTRTSRATQAAELVGAERLAEVERVCIALYTTAAEHARDARHHHRRHEVRARPRRRRQRSCSATRRSRRTPRASGPPTRTSRAARQDSFDKQFVRDYCEHDRLGQDRPRPGAAGRRRRAHALEVHRGVRAADDDPVRGVPREPARGARMRATVLVRPKQGILDPQGAAVETALEHLGFAVSRRTRRQGRRPRGRRRRRRRGARAGREDVRAAAREPADGVVRDRDPWLARSRASASSRIPGSQDDRDALWALAALDAEAVPVWHEETRAARSRRGRAARRLLVRRLPPLRRDRALLAGDARPCASSPTRAGSCSGSATASRSSARPASCRACSSGTSRSASSAATCRSSSSATTCRSRHAARRASDSSSR